MKMKKPKSDCIKKFIGKFSELRICDGTGGISDF
jgi:hypothetical protein